jgi:hypothetical protein
VPQGRGGEPQPARYDDRDSGYRQAWDDDDDDRDDRDDRRGYDPRGSNGSDRRPSKKRSVLGDLLEGFGD